MYLKVSTHINVLQTGTAREMKNDITTLRDDLTVIDKQLNPEKYEEKKK